MLSSSWFWGAKKESSGGKIDPSIARTLACLVENNPCSIASVLDVEFAKKLTFSFMETCSLGGKVSFIARFLDTLDGALVKLPSFRRRSTTFRLRLKDRLSSLSA